MVQVTLSCGDSLEFADNEKIPDWVSHTHQDGKAMACDILVITWDEDGNIHRQYAKP